MTEQEIQKKLSQLAYAVNWQRLLVSNAEETSSPTELAHRHEKLAICEKKLRDFVAEHVHLTEEELSRIFLDNPAHDIHLHAFQQ